MLKRLLLLSLSPLCSRAEELPAPVKATEKQGITIMEPFEAPGGMEGWLGKYQDMGVAIYLMPDGKHTIPGYIYGENGNNPSKQLSRKELHTPAGQETWKKMASIHWLQDGNKDAPIVLYVFAGPFCPYCKRSWQQSRPWVGANKMQIHTLPVGVIKPESPAIAAVTLATKDLVKTWHGCEQSNGKVALTIPQAIPSEKMKVLNVNQQLMDRLGADVTSAIYYMNKNSMLQQVVGLLDKEKLQVMMGEQEQSHCIMTPDDNDRWRPCRR